MWEKGADYAPPVTSRDRGRFRSRKAEKRRATINFRAAALTLTDPSGLQLSLVSPDPWRRIRSGAPVTALPGPCSLHAGPTSDGTGTARFPPGPPPVRPVPPGPAGSLPPRVPCRSPAGCRCRSVAYGEGVTGRQRRLSRALICPETTRVRASRRTRHTPKPPPTNPSPEKRHPHRVLDLCSLLALAAAVAGLSRRRRSPPLPRPTPCSPSTARPATAVAVGDVLERLPRHRHHRHALLQRDRHQRRQVRGVDLHGDCHRQPGRARAPPPSRSPRTPSALAPATSSACSA